MLFLWRLVLDGSRDPRISADPGGHWESILWRSPVSVRKHINTWVPPPQWPDVGYADRTDSVSRERSGHRSTIFILHKPKTIEVIYEPSRNRLGWEKFRARRGSYLVRGHLQAIKWSEVCRSPRDFLTNVQLVLRLLVAKMAGGFWLIQVQHKH